MSINFHDEENRHSYTTRIADESWISLMKLVTDMNNMQVADIGCGGGIYTKALANMGAAHVTGIDYSVEMLKGAATNCANMSNVTFLQGNAYKTNVASNTFDFVLQRALIHHLTDLDTCFQEACRILKMNGTLIVQDRTPQDCLLAGDEHHIRGYFFEQFPKLKSIEVARRYDAEQVQQSLEANGFQVTKLVSLWETRKVHESLESLQHDLLSRAGRSILHELTDTELEQLSTFIQAKLATSTLPIIEKDVWTIWFAQKSD